MYTQPTEVYSSGKISLSGLQAALTRLAETNAALRQRVDEVVYTPPDYSDVSSEQITVASIARALEDRWRRGVLFSDFWDDFSGAQNATTAWNTATAIAAQHPSRKLILPVGSILLSPGITIPGITIESVVSRAAATNRTLVSFAAAPATNCFELDGKVSIRGVNFVNNNSPFVFRDTAGQCDSLDLRDTNIASSYPAIKLGSTAKVGLRNVVVSYATSGTVAVDITGAELDIRSLNIAADTDALKLTSCSGRIDFYISEVGSGIYGNLYLVSCVDLKIDGMIGSCYDDTVSAINLSGCRRIRFRNTKLLNYYEDIEEYSIECSVPCIYWYHCNEIEFEAMFASALTGSAWYLPYGALDLQGQYMKFGGFAYTLTGGLQLLSAAPHNHLNPTRLMYDEITSNTTYHYEPDNSHQHKYGKYEITWSSNPAVGRPMLWIEEKETIWTTLEGPHYPA